MSNKLSLNLGQSREILKFQFQLLKQLMLIPSGELYISPQLMQLLKPDEYILINEALTSDKLSRKKLRKVIGILFPLLGNPAPIRLAFTLYRILVITKETLYLNDIYASILKQTPAFVSVSEIVRFNARALCAFIQRINTGLPIINNTTVLTAEDAMLGIYTWLQGELAHTDIRLTNLVGDYFLHYMKLKGRRFCRYDKRSSSRTTLVQQLRHLIRNMVRENLLITPDITYYIDQPELYQGIIYGDKTKEPCYLNFNSANWVFKPSDSPNDKITTIDPSLYNNWFEMVTEVKMDGRRHSFEFENRLFISDDYGITWHEC